MTSLTSRRLRPWLLTLAGCGLLFALVSPSLTQQQSGPAKDHKDIGKTSYDQIDVPVILGRESFATMMAKDKAAKAAVIARQMALLKERYDLTRRVDEKCLMTRGKPIPVGPAARLPEGMTWEKLAALAPDDIRNKGCSPRASCPCPTSSTTSAAWSSRR